MLRKIGFKNAFHSMTWVVLTLLVACATPTPTATILAPALAQPTATVQPPQPPTSQPTSAPTSTPTLAPTATPTFQPNLAPKKLSTPWQQRKSPRVLLDADDVARIKQLITAQPWAHDVLTRIVNSADGYPANYLKDYALTSPDLPPAGGQWTLWYICPDGLRLQYQPTHNPPHYCPSTKEYFAAPPQWSDRPKLYDEVVYQNRHDALGNYARDLGLAFIFTGNKKYAENAAQILVGYAKQYPTYAHHDKDGKAGRSGAKAHAQTLDEAIWLINMAWAYDLVSDTLAATDRDAIAKNVLRPAVAEIQGNRTGLSNWQTWHNAGIAAVGFALGDEKLVNEAYNDPHQGFFQQLADGAANDGFWWEGSWSYHFYTLNAMLYLAEMGNRAGMDTFASPNLRAMWNAPLQMALPDLSLPRFNDDGGSSVSRQWLYEIAYQRYRDPLFSVPINRARDWRGLLWGAASLPTTSAATQTSTLLPKAGYAVMRHGDHNLIFKFGPYGGGHSHWDELSYIAFAFNRILAFDPGTHSYAATQHKTWDKESLAHNTVVVDETSQGEASGNLHRFVALPVLTLAIADAGKSYPNRAAITRTLVLNADYWLDLTRASSRDGKPHQFDWFYHNPGTVSSSTSLAPYPLSKKNGYENLTETRASPASTDWNLFWDVTDLGKTYGSEFHNNDDIKTSFTITRTADCVCGQIDYDWGAGANAYAVYQTKPLTPPNETPTRMDVRIFGDKSNSRLTLRVMDATGEKFTKDAGVLSWTGWQTITLNIDKTWSHAGSGNNDGTLDLPVSLVAVQLNRATNSARTGRVLVDDLVLTFSHAGRILIEDFPAANLQMKMLGAPETILVLGNGIDETNTPIPFAMARRSAQHTTFAAVFEPYRNSPRIAKIESLAVLPANPSANAIRIVAPNNFTDTILVVDDAPRAERTFGAYSTDAAIAYIRQDKSNKRQTLAVANATSVSEGAQSVLTSSVPITLQVSYVGEALAIDGANLPAAQLRVAAQDATHVLVNGNVARAKREKNDFVINTP